jgi:hypothetical protein
LPAFTKFSFCDNCFGEREGHVTIPITMQFEFDSAIPANAYGRPDPGGAAMNRAPGRAFIDRALMRTIPRRKKKLLESAASH